MALWVANCCYAIDILVFVLRHYVVACEECGTEYEVVGLEPLELARVDEDLDEEDDLFEEDEEEE